MTVLGFTGTRHEPTDAQQSWMNLKLRGCGMTEFHHGACVGADAAAHRIAMDYGTRVIVHPPTDERLMMPPDYLVWNWLHPKPYLDRNRDIVDASERIIALPDGPERPKSGTWYTVRYAVKQGKPVTICYPGGELERR